MDMLLCLCINALFKWERQFPCFNAFSKRKIVNTLMRWIKSALHLNVVILLALSYLIF